MRVTLRATFVAAAAVAGLLAAGSPALAAPAEGQIRDAGKPGAIRDRYIVVLKDTVAASDTASSASRLTDRFGGRLKRSFGTTLKGFSAQLTERGAKRLAANPLVDYVQQDRTVRARRQPGRRAVGPGPHRPGDACRSTAATPTRAPAQQRHRVHHRHRHPPDPQRVRRPGPLRLRLRRQRHRRERLQRPRHPRRRHRRRHHLRRRQGRQPRRRPGAGLQRLRHLLAASSPASTG